MLLNLMFLPLQYIKHHHLGGETFYGSFSVVVVVAVVAIVVVVVPLIVGPRVPLVREFNHHYLLRQ